MPSTGPRKSLDTVQPGSLEEALVGLKLSTTNLEQKRRLDNVLHVLRDVVSGPNICCEDHEALWWEMFAEVFASEVSAQTRASGGVEPSPGCKRQILADILVWAEVTQEHYDSGTQRFVTEPHAADESFQRIGRIFCAAKARRGLGGARRGSGRGGGGAVAADSGKAGGGGEGNAQGPSRRGAAQQRCSSPASCPLAYSGDSDARSDSSTETRG